MNDLIQQIKQIIAQAREQAVRSVDFQRVLMYWHIGERIFVAEQGEQNRADYGSQLIKNLAKELEPEYGSGFGERQLERCRKFYRTFPISSTLRTELNWTQYKLLIRLQDEDERAFYIAESCKNHWSSRQLERQINSQLYQRLLLSNDKTSVLAIANNQAAPSDPKQIIKDPMILEFLDLKPQAAYYEKDLENAILSHIQEFLLELGNGFAFIARQKRLYINGDDFFADLLFYNRLLQCFVVVELKTHKLTHQDIGQLQMYVNYFDRVEKLPHENPTIGILLCADKNNAVVQFTLPENQTQIFASQYQLYLPTVEQLQKELQNFQAACPPTNLFD